MRKFLLSLMTLAMAMPSMQAKTLVVYYSFTNHCRTIAQDLQTQLGDADIVEVQPAEEGLDYAANGYAIGSALISAIRNHPGDASSYPAIKEVGADLGLYDDYVVVTPLWWGNMAAPMQTFLFQNGGKMAGKRVGLIVSSASTSIGGVEVDARRLVPGGEFVKSLWIRSSQTSSCHTMIGGWMAETGMGTPVGISPARGSRQAGISVNGRTLTVNGDFRQVDVYDAAGRRVLSTSSRATDTQGLLDATGTYVAVVRGNQSGASISS